MWPHLLAAATEAGNQGSKSIVPTILLYIVGPAGLFAGLGTLLKLKPDANSQSVVQAQGAAAEWQKIAEDRKKEIEEWRARERAFQGRIDVLEDEITSLRLQLDRIGKV